jgi:large subunit ribosomal protein L32
MPLPKRRHSNARTAKRRTHWKLDKPSVGHCPKCDQPKMPHRACPNCGHYNDRLVFFPKES